MSDVVSAVLLLAGAAVCLLGAVGLVRFPDVLSRLQAATKPQTLGLLLVLAGVAFQVPASSVPLLALIAVFQIMTVPVVGQIAGGAAYRTGQEEPQALVVDELADKS